MEHSFDGRVAVITGAGGVLCSVMAKALAEAGARVALPTVAGASGRVSLRAGERRHSPFD